MIGRILASALALLSPIGAVAQDVVRAEGLLPAGGRWIAERPADWNGTLLLWSRGYGSRAEIQIAPNGTRDWLLAHGYAIAAADYSRPGWALEEAVPDQIAALDAVTAEFGAPKRTIAWGASMGGLITVALAEQYPQRFAGALPSCGSIGGSVGMMNTALDGAFAFKTLIAPDSAIRLVAIDDDMANSKRVQAEIDRAGATPEGRARIALAAVIAGLPAWSDAKLPEPAATDHDAQYAQEATAFVRGVFFPRVDQEARAGGVFSWNTGVDYAARLKASGRMAHVAAMYRAAGLNLKTDLATLAAAPRIAAQPEAIAYMRAHYIPSGDLKIPMLSYHETGDGQTPVILQGAYADAVRATGKAALFQSAWVHGAGHCLFRPAEHIAALKALEQRLNKGRWQSSPKALNANAKASGADGAARFIAYRPARFPRPCTSKMKDCQ